MFIQDFVPADLPWVPFMEGLYGYRYVENTLIDRDGMLIPDAGWYWDHAEQRNKIAQDYLFVNYVCTSGKHYPLEFRLFRKQEVCQAIGEPFPSGATALFVFTQLAVSLVGLMLLGKTAKEGTGWGNLFSLLAMLVGMSGVLLAAALWAAA